LKKGLNEYVAKEKPDILCLQETKINDDEKVRNGHKNVFGNEYEVYFNCCQTQKNYSGTAIFTKVKPISFKTGIGMPEHDNTGRVVTLEFKDFYLIDCYVPNVGMKLDKMEYRQKWDDDFLKYLKEIEQKKTNFINWWFKCCT